MTTKIELVTGGSRGLGKKMALAAKGTLLLVAAIVLAATSFGQTMWTTDKNHAQLHFSVFHYGIAHIEGIFKEFTVTLTSEKDDFSGAQVEMVAQVTSINTQMEMRDNDLRSRSWFDAEQFPVITFKSTSFKKVMGKNYRLAGNISLHGETIPIVFNVVFNGWAVTRTQRKTAGFTVTGKVKRSDFNLGGTPIETGISNEIEVWANVEIGKN
ncbi:MAG TPA: YceI family protein [Mucilaginibacter sp.]|jgi:polyisoprenoid-binding protein YceI|nr:YceI family protein [Mucilaginibacter sp.]